MNNAKIKSWMITATAMAAAAMLTLSGCGSGAESKADADEATFTAAGLFPLTGSMAYL